MRICECGEIRKFRLDFLRPVANQATFLPVPIDEDSTTSQQKKAEIVDFDSALRRGRGSTWWVLIPPLFLRLLPLFRRPPLFCSINILFGTGGHMQQ